VQLLYIRSVELEQAKGNHFIMQNTGLYPRVVVFYSRARARAHTHKFVVADFALLE
jgi:hypothetical protein